MIISKKGDRLPSDNDGRLSSCNVIDPIRYIFKVILMSADSLFLIYLSWASQKLSELNLSYPSNIDFFKSLSLLWVLRFFWGLCYDKLSFTLTGNYYRLKYALSLFKYYIMSIVNSIIMYKRQGKFKLYFDPTEYPIDTHIYETKRKSQMIIISHLLTLLGLQIITITHWIMPFELLNLNENLQYIKFIGILLIGISIVGQSSANDVRLYCDVKEASMDKQILYLCEALSFKALFGFIAQILLFNNKIHYFKYIIITKCLIAISVLSYRDDIGRSLQIRYFSNKMDNFGILVPCLWFFIILHSGIDSRWYFQRFGMRDFPLSNLFDVLATLLNQLAKIAISIAIGFHIDFTSFPKLFPFSIAFCIILKLIGFIILKFNVDSIYMLSLVVFETICSSFVQQAVLIIILMICITAPTTIPIALMSLPAVCMQYSTILRYSSSIWSSILSSQSSLVTIQAISISIYLAALVTCWNIKFDKITTKTKDVHRAYINRLARENEKVSFGVEDDKFWGSDD